MRKIISLLVKYNLLFIIKILNKYTDKYTDFELYLSITFKNINVIRFLNLTNDNLKIFDYYYDIVKTNDLDFIKILISNRSINELDLYYFLVCSIEYRYFDLADYFISIGSNINYRFDWILCDNVRHDRIDKIKTIEYCLKNHANPNEISETDLNYVDDDNVWMLLIQYGLKYDILTKKETKDKYKKVRNKLLFEKLNKLI